MPDFQLTPVHDGYKDEIFNGVAAKVFYYQPFEVGYSKRYLAKFPEFKVIITNNDEVYLSSFINAPNETRQNGPKLYVEVVTSTGVLACDLAQEFGEFHWENHTNQICQIPTVGNRKVCPGAFMTVRIPRVRFKW